MAGRKKHRLHGPVNYSPPKVLIRTRRGRPTYDYDQDLADRLLAASLDPTVPNYTHASPKGKCYICDKKIMPGRKLCGPCAAERDADRNNR